MVINKGYLKKNEKILWKKSEIIDIRASYINSIIRHICWLGAIIILMILTILLLQIRIDFLIAVAISSGGYSIAIIIQGFCLYSVNSDYKRIIQLIRDNHENPRQYKKELVITEHHWIQKNTKNYIDPAKGHGIEILRWDIGAIPLKTIDTINIFEPANKDSISEYKFYLLKVIDKGRNKIFDDLSYLRISLSYDEYKTLIQVLKRVINFEEELFLSKNKIFYLYRRKEYSKITNDYGTDVAIAW